MKGKVKLTREHAFGFGILYDWKYREFGLMFLCWVLILDFYES